MTPREYLDLSSAETWQKLLAAHDPSCGWEDCGHTARRIAPIVAEAITRAQADALEAAAKVAEETRTSFAEAHGQFSAARKAIATAIRTLSPSILDAGWREIESIVEEAECLANEYGGDFRHLTHDELAGFMSRISCASLPPPPAENTEEAKSDDWLGKVLRDNEADYADLPVSLKGGSHD